jgi:hypothetical protein
LLVIPSGCTLSTTPMMKEGSSGAMHVRNDLPVR